MNEQAPLAADPGELQFDKAEFAEPNAGEPVCAACHQAIPDQYYQLNGQILCEGCSTAIQTSLTGGSSLKRFIKANLYGFAAAIAGFAIYFGILKITGYQIGLISILVGYMVGAAVRKGSEGRGGVLYQLMAVFFTYLAIAISYSALMIPQMIEQIKVDRAAEQAKKAAQAKNPDNAGNAIGANNAELKNEADGNADGVAVEQPPVAFGGFVFAVAFLIAFLLALPVLAGFSQPIGLLIVGFALWEAFKMNRKINFVITGPHNVGPALDQAPANA